MVVLSNPSFQAKFHLQLVEKSQLNFDMVEGLCANLGDRIVFLCFPNNDNPNAANKCWKVILKTILQKIAFSIEINQLFSQHSPNSADHTEIQKIYLRQLY